MISRRYQTEEQIERRNLLKEREQNGMIEEEKERRSFQTVRRKKRWIRLIHFKAYFPCVKLYISFGFKQKLCTTFIILQS